MYEPDNSFKFNQFSLMAKPAGAVCNLACEYCYYLDKAQLYPGRKQLMSDETLERYVGEYIASQRQEAVMFVWHGGEALMRDRRFYERVIELQQKYANGHHIDNSLQTNGILINEDWCRFFKDHNFLIGLSIDGPQRFHDEYRRDKKGKPTFLRILRAARLLNLYGVDWNAMAVVNDYNSEYPVEFYRFFRDTLECNYLQFAPIVERTVSGRLIEPDAEIGEIAPFSVSPDKWGKFLCEIFDEWVRKDVGKMFVQLFDSTLANWVGVPPGVCTMGEGCGSALVVEYNGDVYSCDHFVSWDHCLGNLADMPLRKMLSCDKHRKFVEFSRNLSAKCKECRYLFACHGECLKNRIVPMGEGHPRHNYLCDGYYKFFSHTDHAMRFMKNEILCGRTPSNVMNQYCL